MKVSNPKLIKVAEAARLVECTPKTYLKWADANLVPAPIKIGDGDELRVVAKELDEWLKAKQAERDRKARALPCPIFEKPRNQGTNQGSPKR